eukprot:CAMPEP_0197005428 /NCGR_PEP_ID=MMETSP1380-20130617/29300_1 /TAXON_ID=5936 /ORGANISM="Euplotes crassus, Strain CT5" /LENGTH=63 /DNA_ID=CAMNT_0042424565 /DNA_START=51 /DNA_END=242 /DNA_ORIENTATION=+
MTKGSVLILIIIEIFTDEIMMSLTLDEEHILGYAQMSLIPLEELARIFSSVLMLMSVAKEYSS